MFYKISVLKNFAVFTGKKFRPRKKLLLFPEMWVTKNLFIRRENIFINEFNLIFEIKLTVKELL